MGAGSFPAGAGPAGRDPLPEPSPAPVRRGPGVPLFDAATRSFPLAGNGDLKRVHWVDQKVALKLGIQQGNVPSAPTLGSTLSELKRGAPEQLVVKAQDAVRFCLLQMTDEREIQLLRVAASSPERGKLHVIVEYQNLLLPTEPPRSVRVGA